jgi:DNA-binding CsgD family transcriptional regulator
MTSEDPRVFVGRGAELAALRALVTAVAQGAGDVAWVEGEPGIGKSALVAESLIDAADLGCWVFRAAADPLRGRSPLGVLLDCLGVAGGSADEERGEIAALLRGEGGGGMLPAGDAVAVAAERMLALVDRLCAVSPVVIVVDDLQWADDVSVSVWHRLAGAAAQVPLLVVGVSRPVPRSPAVVAARQSVVRRGGVVVEVQPLREAAVKALVADLAGGRPGPGLLAQTDRAGGNPLYVREMVDALVREGRVRVSGSVAEVVGGAVGPVSLAAAIEARLGFLPERTVAVLRVAALLGVRFSMRDLAVVAGVPGPELAGVVSEAVASGVLAESGTEVAFRHGLIQQALADGMPAGLRAELRWEAARALADAGAVPDQVAAQLLEAGPVGEPDQWVGEWLAGHSAVLIHRAPQAAAELLGQVVAGMAAEDPRRGQLMEQLAGVLFLLARYEQAEPVARALLAKTGDRRRRDRMAWTLAYILLRTGRSAQALAVTDAALRDGDGPDLWRARLLSLRALVLMSDARYGEADAEAAAGLEEADRAGDRFAAGWALHVQSVIRGADGDFARFLEFIEQALAVIGDDQETSDLRVLLLTNRLAAHGNLDQDIDTEARQLLALAEQVGTARISMVREMQAEYSFEVGAWDDALVELDILFEPCADVLDYAVVGGRGLAALIAAHRDDRARLAAHLRAAQELPDLVGRRKPTYSVDLLRAKGVAAEQNGRLSEAMAFLTEAVAAGDTGLPAVLHCQVDLVRCALAAGDRTAAAVAVARIEGEAARSGGSSVGVAAARWCTGLLSADPVPLGEAIAYYRTVTRPLELGQVLEDLAVVRAVGGDSAAAKVALREAVQIYAGLGAEWDILRADTRLRPYGVRRRRLGTRRPEYGWDALTPTEEKIAFLVSAGLSNPDIGKRLYLSRHTVESHVRKVLAKLQVRSRVEVATAAAARRDASGSK